MRALAADIGPASDVRVTLGVASRQSALCHVYQYVVEEGASVDIVAATRAAQIKSHWPDGSTNHVKQKTRGISSVVPMRL